MKYIRSSILASLMLLLATPQLHTMNNNNQVGVLNVTNDLALHINDLGTTINFLPTTNTNDRNDINNIIVWLRDFRGRNLRYAPLHTLTQLFTRLQELTTQYKPASEINFDSYYFQAENSNPYPIFEKQLPLSNRPQTDSFESHQSNASTTQNDDDDSDTDYGSDSDDFDKQETFLQRLAKFIKGKLPKSGSNNIISCSQLFHSYDLKDIAKQVKQTIETSQTDNDHAMQSDLHDIQAIITWIDAYSGQSKRWAVHKTIQTMLDRLYVLISKYDKTDWLQNNNLELFKTRYTGYRSAYKTSETDSYFNAEINFSSWHSNFGTQIPQLLQNRLVIAGGGVGIVAIIYWLYNKKVSHAQDDTNADIESENKE